MPIVTASIIGGGASLLGGLIGAGGAQSAANTQARAANNATQLQSNIYGQTVSNESPFLGAGVGATGQLNYLLGNSNQVPGEAGSTAGGFGSLNTAYPSLQPFTADTFKQYSPAYQFQLQQGAQGTLNQDAGAQGAESGAALKDLTSYNQGMANTSFNNAFNQYLGQQQQGFSQYQTQQNNVFNRLSTLAGMGQSAASNQATGASSFAGSIGQSASNVGSALAGGTVGATNAITGALGGAASYAALPWLTANQSTAPPSTAVSFQRDQIPFGLVPMPQHGWTGGSIFPQNT